MDNWMKQKILTINQDIYVEYYSMSYVLSLLCLKDVLSKLENDYSMDLVKESDLLSFIYSVLIDDYIAFINGDSRIEGNLNKIILNSSSSNSEIVNKIKIFLNSFEHPPIY